MLATPAPANRTSSSFPPNNSAATPGPSFQNKPSHPLGPVYPPLPAYETALTGHRPAASTSANQIQQQNQQQQQVSSLQCSGGGQAAQPGQNAAPPAPQAYTAPQPAQQSTQVKNQKEQYTVQVSSQALRLSRARSSFTTLRYNILFALVLLVVSSSRPYKMLKHAFLPASRSWHAGVHHAENAFLTLFFVNITYAIYCLCTLPQGSDNKVTMTMESPEKSRIGGSRMTPVQRSNPASRPSTPYASSPISKPIVPRSGSASHKQQQQAAAPGSSPVRLGNDTPTSKLRAALLGSQAHQSSPGRGSPSRGVASTPPRPGTTPFGGTSHSPSSPAFSSPSSQVHTPARDESLREAAFLSRHSPSESSPRRVMSGRAALQAIS